ncbi:hypothetical protein KP509_10G001800 [Ceratopteris richardii]|uniref:Ig-like domain-containing protein n=1 Tax=Ceratopteris richardii TaxID=49495 RepID=A0A8T2TXQ8_CERRI|nr:hypothetical protein KP509_10G001800 [Ceratopteris richardii]
MERFRGSSITGYGNHAATVPSKAERIMSRYRPIAPKPAIPCNVSELERSVASSITFDSFCARQVPDACVPISSTQPPKTKSKRVRKRSCKDNEVQQPLTKRQALDPSVGQACEKPPTFERFSYGLPTESTPILMQDDAGFMERAAASAPLSVLPPEKRQVLQSNGSSNGGCFSEMIRGIAGVPPVNRVNNLLQQQPCQRELSNPLCQQALLPAFGQSLKGENPTQCSRSLSKEDLSVNFAWLCNQMAVDPQEQASERTSSEQTGEKAFSEDVQESGLDEEGNAKENNQRRSMVTLSLLPEATTRLESPTPSTCSTDSSQMSSSYTTIPCLRQTYGEVPEPLVLVDDLTHKVLWLNQGYSRACRGNPTTLQAPFVDLLGAPMQTGRFQLQLQGQPDCTFATLWGFSGKTSAVRGGTKTDQNAVLLCGQQPETPSDASGDTNPFHRSKVIIPQPIRLVDSVISVESITDVQNGNVGSVSLEHAKRQLEESNLPALITDSLNVVRWVNTAYKAMVGQPKCPWLTSTVKDGGFSSKASPTITGEVLLSCNVKIPTFAMCFSGRVNVQWTRNTRERSSMTLPCDVTAVMAEHARKMLVWRFDIHASLSLTCAATGR